MYVVIFSRRWRWVNLKVINNVVKEGRTALHYAALCRDPAAAAGLLEGAGGARAARDAAGHTPAFYRQHRALLVLPSPPPDMTPENRSPPGKYVYNEKVQRCTTLRCATTQYRGVPARGGARDAAARLLPPPTPHIARAARAAAGHGPPEQEPAWWVHISRLSIQPSSTASRAD